jgi:hypothetical protein
MRLIPLGVFLVAVSAFAQDAQLEALHATLVSLHSQAAETNVDTRGATPELTVAKHQLRDWIESQLSSLKDLDDTKALSDRINQALTPVSIAGPRGNQGADQNLLGTLGEIRFSGKAGMLIVTAAVGILCGDDESAYGYQFQNGHWRRIWESEQNDYTPKKYAPQHIATVHVSRSFQGGQPDGPPFVLTLGREDWCTSTWHPVYYRVWRIDSTGPKLLIDRTEGAYLRSETSLVGSISQEQGVHNPPADVLIEFAERSIDAGVHNREAVRHFLIDGDRVRRVDLVALSPRDFVDEWLTRTWNESAGWSASPALQQWHSKLHSDFVAGQFVGVTRHCQTPDLWQVAFEPDDAKKDFAPQPKVYFLVRWTPPYRFTLTSISDKPSPLCTQPDREADAWRTLFNTQEWRR